MLARVSAVRRVPQLVVIARRNASSVKEGSVAQSRGFSEKEKAHENQYVKQHEQQLLKKLKEKIDAKKAELERLEKEAEEVAKK